MSHTLPARLLQTALLAALIPAAQASEFVYQGQLDDRGAPANGRFDLRIAAFAGAQSPQTLMAPIEFPGVEVRDGRFELRFDAPLAGDRDAWLEVAVRDAGASAYAAIPGRSKAIAAPLIGACWSVTGDAGSNPTTNFLGTTDAQPLVLRTANAQSLRIEPSTLTFNGLPITANVIAGSHANNVGAGVRGATIAGGGAPVNSDPDWQGNTPNSVADHYGTVSGGYGNVAAGQRATIGGGDRNEAANGATIGGGSLNDAGNGATVGGGESNNAAGSASTIAGGELNATTGPLATVGGGTNNTASTLATVGGGHYNHAFGNYSMVPGGSLNCAGGSYSFAGGLDAHVRPESAVPGPACAGATSGTPDGDAGSFVWAGASGSWSSSGRNQFVVNANGGAMFNVNGLVSASDDFVIGARSGSDGGDADADLRLVTRTGRSADLFVTDGQGQLRILLPNLLAGTDRLSVSGGSGGAATLSNGGTWTNASSRTFKEGFAAIDPLDVLDRVLALGISRWSYIGSSEGEHIGPMAEDFHAAFGLGHSAQQIATVDADGIALAAIQGLNAKLEAENGALRKELEALRALVESRLQEH